MSDAPREQALLAAAGVPGSTESHVVRLAPAGESTTGLTADRLAALSDAVIAVIMTVLVLELRAPAEKTLPALLALWPTVISYAMSYLFIAIIWINHHHLLRFVGPPTLRLIWINFAHLFPVSFLPFATAWVARTRLAPVPVAFYGATFVCVDIAYNVFE